VRVPGPGGDARRFVIALAGYAVFFALFFLRSFLSGRYIAPSDTLDLGLSSFLAPQSVWTEGMYSGFPVAAEPQSLKWYPPFRLLQALGVHWNLFMVMAYVVASGTAFLLARRIAQSTVAGVFAGLAFGYSGYMLSHVSHFNQIHAAAWLPLVCYGLVRIRGGSSAPACSSPPSHLR
jgi:hypothetical protein